MSSFLDKFIADTYNGLLHSDSGLGESGISQIFDGDGNKSALSLGRENEGAKITGNLNAASASIDQDLVVGGDITSDDITGDAIKANSIDTGTIIITNSLQAAKVNYPVSNSVVSIFELIYPIGSIYLNVLDINPGSVFSGTTWVKVSEGRFLVGVGSGNDGSTNKTFTVGDNYGEYDHKLSVGEMPSHTHSLMHPDGEQFYLINDGNDQAPTSDGRFRADGPNADNDGRYSPTIQKTGGDVAHNNIPPGFGVYVWQRTL
jgi:hypothetical protein